jgi:lysophospholipase L1-like esterase
VEGFARNPHGYCWAKQFKEYMEAHYNCTVVNNACTGTRIEFVLDHFDELVDPRDDVVICTIGTNNRHRYFKDGPKPEVEAWKAAFYANVLKLHERFLKSGKDYVLIANIPAAASNEADGADYWRVIHMNDINDLYKKAAAEKSFAFVSMYDLFTDYCHQNAVTVDELLSDGLHPNAQGFDVMLALLKEAFGV